MNTYFLSYIGKEERSCKEFRSYLKLNGAEEISELTFKLKTNADFEFLRKQLKDVTQLEGVVSVMYNSDNGPIYRRIP